MRSYAPAPRIEVVYAGPRPQPGKMFSNVELGHLAIAFFGLLTMFGISDVLYPPFFAAGWTLADRALFFLPVAAASVGTAFLLHEMAHKFVARRFNCWAEFRSAPLWLGLGIVMAIVLRGFFFAAPGAVWSAGATSKRQNGIISGVGPVTNLVLCLALLPAVVVLSQGSSFELWYAVRAVASLNAFLGFFNMLPLSLGMPLDGVKVLDWDVRIFIALIVPCAALTAVFFVGLV